MVLPTDASDKARTREHRGKVYTLSPTHPLCEVFPWPDQEDIDRMAADIREYEQRLPILRLPDGTLIDGKTRELAALVAGDTPVYQTIDCPESAIPALIASLNLHRRHLGSKAKRTLTAAVLKAEPHRSNRDVAATVGVSDKTVAGVREHLESTAEIPQLTERRGSDGRTRPVPAATPPSVQPSPDNYDREGEQTDGPRPATSAERTTTPTPVKPAEVSREDRDLSPVRQAIADAERYMALLGQAVETILRSRAANSFRAKAKARAIPTLVTERERLADINDTALERVESWPVLAEVQAVFAAVKAELLGKGVGR